MKKINDMKTSGATAGLSSSAESKNNGSTAGQASSGTHILLRGILSLLIVLALSLAGCNDGSKIHGQEIRRLGVEVLRRSHA